MCKEYWEFEAEIMEIKVAEIKVYKNELSLLNFVC